MSDLTAEYIRVGAENERLRAENEKLRANFQVLADTVRVAKDAASYNRHKNEHCVSRSIWSALSDQEKYARKVLSDLRAAKAALEKGNNES